MTGAIKACKCVLLICRVLSYNSSLMKSRTAVALFSASFSAAVLMFPEVAVHVPIATTPATSGLVKVGQVCFPTSRLPGRHGPKSWAFWMPWSVYLATPHWLPTSSTKSSEEARSSPVELVVSAIILARLVLGAAAGPDNPSQLLPRGKFEVCTRSFVGQTLLVEVLAVGIGDDKVDRHGHRDKLNLVGDDGKNHDQFLVPGGVELTLAVIIACARNRANNMRDQTK